MTRGVRSVLTVVMACLLGGSLLSVAATSAAGAATPVELSLKVLLIGTGSTDPTTAAWQSALSQEGVAYTEVTATGTYGAETVTLPALTTGSVGNFNGVVVADSPAAFAAGQLTALDSYEVSDGVRQIDGYSAPYTGIGLTEVSTGALDGTTGTLTAAGLAALPELAGPIPFATGTNGYWSTVVNGAPFTPWLDNAAGQVLAGVYQHPATDPQANVAELELGFDYNATQLQWELLAPGLINWVTRDSHLGINRNYVEMDIDDTFTPDNAWSTTVHDNDYSDADSLRMDAADVISSADWSNPTQENAPSARPAGEPATAFRLDQLFNYGGTVEYQNGELDLPGEPAACSAAGDAAGTCGPDPLLAQFQATDPATGKPYSDDFGWLSHTYDTPYLDVGCATQDYIEAELNENTSDVTAAPGATAGTGGLGLPESTIASGAADVANPYGTYNPQVFVPGNHSGFADLDPGTPATVDPPDLDEATAATTGGTLGAGTYEYAVTDQFNGADSTTTDQSQAYVTDGLQGDVAPVVVTGSTGSVSLTWQSICHAADYIIYRAPVSGTTVGPWTEIGTYATPDSAILPDNSSGDTSPAQTATVCSGPTYAPTSCAGEQELTFTDTGGTSATPPAGVTYLDTATPAGWTPPVVEDADELPWEQNPYFSTALTAAGITTVGADASKAYPDPANDQFGIGATYTGATYAAGQPFVDGTSQVAPRHPINIFYNAGTNAEELDEYNTLYTSTAPDSQCHDTSTITCATTPYTFADVINQVVSGMFTNMLSNDPEISYVHQTNTIGTPPYSTTLPPAGYVPAATAQPGTDGDGTLYEVLNPLISEYDSYFSSDTPYVQLTLGGVGQVLANQAAWSAAQTAGTVTATEENGVVTVKNTGLGAVNVPVTAPAGTTIGGSAFGSSYDGQVSAWTSVAAGGSVSLLENLAPTVTSADSANSIVGAAFDDTVTATGYPAPVLSETGPLPSGITFVDDGNGTATIAGTPAAGTGGSYPINITATSSAGSNTQTFTLTNSQAPTIPSASVASFSTGVAGTFTMTTTGYPAATITESGTLPAGLTFTTGATGTATIAGTAATGTAGSYPVTISATNSSGSTATLALTITVGVGAPPTVTSGATASFTLGDAGSLAVTTTGSPIPAITETGTLPTGLTFVDNGSGTAILAGTPTATGTFPLTVTATNGAGTVTQSFTLTVDQAPTITSASSDTVPLGTAFTFPVTTTGYPAAALTDTGTLPTGVTFVDNGNGTATLAGTPTATGTFPLTVNAASTAGTVTQSFTLTVDQAPTITSAGSDTVPLGTAFTFPVATAGFPAASLSETGALPTGVTFVTTGNGTATLAGTPTATGGFPITITATSTAGTVTQSFTLTVEQAPTITSAGSDTATLGDAFTFPVTTTGFPAPTLTESGALPTGVTFVANGNGTATLAGTPTATGGFPLTITATSTAGTVTQSFTLTVDQAPTITSAGSDTATLGDAFTFPVTTTGFPAPTLTESGALPTGVTFVANGNGTATLAGTPTASGGFPITITATSTAGTVTQSFTLSVDRAPTITSAGSDTVTLGNAFTFPVTTTGYPAPALTETGALPAGVAFVDNGNGTATLAGTPTATGGFPVTITATNTGTGTGHRHRATQSFTLTVDQAPAFTSAASDTVTLGDAFTFPVTTAGYPAPTLTETGALPTGVTFVANGNGTATLAGTPTASGGFPLTITAASTAGTVTQHLTLSVDRAPTITSTSSDTVTLGSTFTFPVTTTGYPAPTLTETGALPAGVTFVDNGNGTATLAGRPTASGGFPLTISADGTGTVAQSFTLTVDQAPAFTSAASDTVTLGTAFDFPVTTVGYPAPEVTETGTLPAGVAIVAGADGVATIAGTPTATGVFALAVTATNGSGTVTQHLTLTVDQAPTVTSASSDAVKVGTAFSFKVATTGYPAPALTETGALPAGVTFTAGAGGTATLSGTPPTVGTSTFAITATSTVGTVTQSFTLTVDQAPTITSSGSYTATLGTAFNFPVTTTGYPAPALTEVGALPAGVTFETFGSGTGTIAGTPTSTGVFALTVTASSTAGTVSQHFTLTVDQAPTITSAGSYGAKVGAAFSFKVTTTGYPAPTLTETGTLPAGVTFDASANGTATIAGKPTTVTAAKGSELSITATSAAGTATQVFTLTVSRSPSITSASSYTAKVGTAFSFAVISTGTPAPTLTESGALPAGVAFDPSANGTATIAGKPTAVTAAKGARLTITATNAAGTVTQVFMLTVSRSPSITSASSYTAKVGTAFSFAVTATGTPVPTLTEAGALPAGVTFVAGSTGMATLSGTPHAVTSPERGPALDHGRQFCRQGRPDLHPHRRPCPGHHQRRLGHRPPRYRLHLPGDHHRHAGTDPHRDRCPARRGHVRPKRERHGHPLGHAHHIRRVPHHHHRGQHRGHGDPALHAHHRSGAGHHQRRLGHRDLPHRVQLPGDSHRVPGTDPHRDRRPARRGDLRQQRERDGHARRRTFGLRWVPTLHHRHQRHRHGDPELHVHGRPGPDRHQCRLGRRHPGHRLQLPGDHRRVPGTDPHRDRRPARGGDLRGQRQRDGHHRRDTRDLRRIPTHHHRHQHGGHGDPAPHPHHRPGPDLHQRRFGRRHPGHRLQLPGDHRRVPGTDPHRDRGPARGGDLRGRRQRDGHPGRDAHGHRSVPDHPHRHRHRGHRDPALRPHHRPGPGHHQRRLGHRRPGHRLHLPRDHHGLPGARGHRDRGSARWGHLRHPGQRHGHHRRDTLGYRRVRAGHHRHQRHGNGEPALHAHHRPGAGHHQRRLGHRHHGYRLHLPDDRHRLPRTGGVRDRNPARRSHLRRRRQRHRHPLGHADHGGDLHVHRLRHQHGGHGDPDLHPHRRPGPNRHQRRLAHRHPGHRIHLPGDHRRNPGTGPHRDRRPAPRRHLR